MTAQTDTARVVRYLRDHPRSSVMELRFALFISGVTQRMSDARKAGYDFHKYRDAKGTFRYSVIEPGAGHSRTAVGSCLVTAYERCPRCGRIQEAGDTCRRCR